MLRACHVVTMVCGKWRSCSDHGLAWLEQGCTIIDRGGYKIYATPPHFLIYMAIHILVSAQLYRPAEKRKLNFEVQVGSKNKIIEIQVVADTKLCNMAQMFSHVKNHVKRKTNPIQAHKLQIRNPQWSTELNLSSCQRALKCVYQNTQRA
jgi:hypothetical protein